MKSMIFLKLSKPSKGLTLIEVLFSLIIASLIAAFAAKIYFSSLNADVGAVDGKNLSFVTEGLERYIVDAYPHVSGQVKSLGSVKITNVDQFLRRGCSGIVTPRSDLFPGDIEPPVAYMSCSPTAFDTLYPVMAKEGFSSINADLQWNKDHIVTRVYFGNDITKSKLATIANPIQVAANISQKAGQTVKSNAIVFYSNTSTPPSAPTSDASSAGNLYAIIDSSGVRSDIYLRRDGTVSMTGDLNMGTNNISNTTLVSAKNLTALSQILSNGGLTVDGDAVLGKELTVSGNTRLKNTLNVTGGTTLQNTLNVAGNTTLTNNLSVAGSSDLERLRVRTTSNLDGQVTAGSNVTVAQTLLSKNIISDVMESDQIYLTENTNRLSDLREGVYRISNVNFADVRSVTIPKTSLNCARGFTPAVYATVTGVQPYKNVNTPILGTSVVIVDNASNFFIYGQALVQCQITPPNPDCVAPTNGKGVLLDSRNHDFYNFGVTIFGRCIS
jgi:prepilin-type N-terminal cleavage/methylation domain-containing protein